MRCLRFKGGWTCRFEPCAGCADYGDHYKCIHGQVRAAPQAAASIFGRMARETAAPQAMGPSGSATKSSVSLSLPHDAAPQAKVSVFEAQGKAAHLPPRLLEGKGAVFVARNRQTRSRCSTTSKGVSLSQDGSGSAMKGSVSPSAPHGQMSSNATAFSKTWAHRENTHSIPWVP